MKHTKLLLPLHEQDHMPNHGEINIQIYKKLIDMGLNEDISFKQFLLNWKIDEETYLLRLHYTIQKPILFRKVGKNGQAINQVLALGPEHDKIRARWASNVTSKNMLERV
jgi:hypothetical protein